MKRLLFYLVASFLFSGSDAAPKLLKPRKSCPSGWQSFQGSCYFIAINQIQGLTFEHAQAKCESLYAGSSLVALETIEETNFIKQYLKQHYPTIRPHTSNGWMTSGYRVNGEWTWKTTGASIDTAAFHWGPGQPDNRICLAFWPYYQFDMSDVLCTSFPRQIICEI